LRVLALKVQGQSEIGMSSVNFPQLFVNLNFKFSITLPSSVGMGAYLGIIACSFSSSSIAASYFSSFTSVLVFWNLFSPFLGSNSFNNLSLYLRLLKELQRINKIPLRSRRHAHKRIQHWIPRIDIDGLTEMLRGIIVLLLLVRDIAEAPPSIVVPRVEVQSIFEHFLGFAELLVVDVLVAAQGVGVRVVGV
jgi:hypothetical protein